MWRSLVNIMRVITRATNVLAVVVSMVAVVGSAAAQTELGPYQTDSVVTVAGQREPSESSSSLITGTNPLEALAAVGELVSRREPGVDGGSTPSDGLSTPIKIIAVLTVITLAPSIILMTTCFVRILIVIGLLKQAIGTQSLPPPQVVVGLALFMTLLVMTPTIDRLRKEAIEPYQSGTITNYDVLWEKARQPIRDFMFAQIDEQGNWTSVYSVLELRGTDVSDPSKLTRADVDMVSLVPAFMLSELKTAFLIGFRVFLPFLVIDIVISTILISMGMMMLPPVLISLPFKLLLFVLVDGWQLVASSLIRSFVANPVSTSESAMAPAHVIELCADMPRLMLQAMGVLHA
jgi:flagellar biosynthesis protein FliP